MRVAAVVLMSIAMSVTMSVIRTGIPSSGDPYMPPVCVAPVARVIVIARRWWLSPIPPTPFIPVAYTVPVFIYPYMPWAGWRRAHIYRAAGSYGNIYLR